MLEMKFNHEVIQILNANDLIHYIQSAMSARYFIVSKKNPVLLITLHSLSKAISKKEETITRTWKFRYILGKK